MGFCRKLQVLNPNHFPMEVILAEFNTYEVLSALMLTASPMFLFKVQGKISSLAAPSLVTVTFETDLAKTL